MNEQRLAIAAQILAGFCANPAVYSEKDLPKYALALADELISRAEATERVTESTGPR